MSAPTTTNGSSDERDAARSASRGCEHCGAEGLATIFHPDYRGYVIEEREAIGRDGEIRPRPMAMRVAAHCTCPMGVWMRANTEAETRRRIPDLAGVLEGRSRWVAADPMGDRPANFNREDHHEKVGA